MAHRKLPPPVPGLNEAASKKCAAAPIKPEAASPHPSWKSPRGVRGQVHFQIEGRGRDAHSAPGGLAEQLRLKGGHLGPGRLGGLGEVSRLAVWSGSPKLAPDLGVQNLQDRRPRALTHPRRHFPLSSPQALPRSVL